VRWATWSSNRARMFAA